MRRALKLVPFLLAGAGAAMAQTQFTIQIVTSSPLPTGQVGATYLPSGATEQLAATNSAGAVRWTVVGGQLPPDFVLDGSTTSSGGTICVGVLNDIGVAFCSGVAQTKDQGTWNFTIQATDSQNLNNTTTKQFGLAVTASGPPSINSQLLPVAYVGQSYSYQFTASGGVPPLRWIEETALSTFPGSFSLSSSGLLSSQQVTQADFNARSGGLYTFRVQVLDANNRASSAAQFNLTISQGLTITTSSPLPSGTVGSSYQGGSGLQLQATGGSGDYSWQISSGALPSGLSMTSGGFISGTPSAGVTQQQFTVQVTDLGTTSTSFPYTTKTFTMSVVSSSLSIVQTTLTPSFAIQNQAYSTTLTAQGGQSPYTWSLGANSVTGLTIGASTGVLSGTPTNAPGSYSITVIVQDSASGTYQFTFSLSIAAKLSISTTSLPNGTVGQSYTATVNEGGGQGPYQWSLAAGSSPPGLTLQSSTGNSVTISGTPTANGVYQFTIQVKDNTSATATAPLQIQIGANVSITTTVLPDGSQGVTYNQNVVATGGQTPYTWTITSGTVPAGLCPSGCTTSTDTTMFIISGTPTGQGPSQFTVQVKDAQGNTAQQALSINIGVPLVITTVTVPNGTVGVAYSLPLGASGGTAPYNWSVINGTLPGGVSLNAANGLLSGSPTTAGNYSFTVQVKDSSGATAQRAFSLSIIAGLSLSNGSFTGQVGTPFSQSLTASGGTPPYSFAVQSGTLPAGVNFSTSGSFSGTPTAAGNSSLVVVVTDSSSPVATANASVTIAISLNTPPPLTIAPIAPSPGAQPALTLTLGGAFSVDLTGTVVLTFASSVGGDDQTVGFTDGTKTAKFTIPAGRTTATFPTANFGVRTGTVAGTITLAVTQLLAGTTDVTPSPAPRAQIVIPPSAPVLTAVTCAVSSGGFTVSVTGFTTTRSMVSGTFNFTAPSGGTIQNGSTSALVQLAAPFNTWFTSATSNATGGQFLLTMPFTIATGSAAGIGVTTALGNSVSGSNTLSATCQ